MQEAAGSPRFPGIGKKTAERLLLELKDKLDVDACVARRRDAATPAAATSCNALLALGYSDKEAQAAVEAACRRT